MAKELAPKRMDRSEIDRRVITFFRDPAIVRCTKHVLRTPNTELSHPKIIPHKLPK